MRFGIKILPACGSAPAIHSDVMRKEDLGIWDRKGDAYFKETRPLAIWVVHAPARSQSCSG